MFRRLRQWLLADPELTALARDIERNYDKAADALHRCEGLGLRMERLANRTNMRMNRAGAPREDERDAEIMDELKGGARRPRGFEDDPFFNQ